MGVELFRCPAVAPSSTSSRPGRTTPGHYTIEACETSQFENHLRGVLDLPLGAVDLRSPSAVMVNLLGTRDGDARTRIAGALAVPGAHLHLYGKARGPRAAQDGARHGARRDDRGCPPACAPRRGGGGAVSRVGTGRSAR